MHKMQSQYQLAELDDSAATERQRAAVYQARSAD